MEDYIQKGLVEKLSFSEICCEIEKALADKTLSGADREELERQYKKASNIAALMHGIGD